MDGIIAGGLCVVLAIGAFIISYFSFREKGFLFNNAYLYASKEEAESARDSVKRNRA